MKYPKLFLLISVLCSSLPILAQNKTSIQIYINPYLQDILPIQKIEKGLGYYKVDMYNKNNPEIGINLSVPLQHEAWAYGFGLSYNRYNYTYVCNITDPASEYMNQQHNVLPISTHKYLDKYLRMDMFSYSASLNYRLNKWTFSTSIIMQLPVHIQTNLSQKPETDSLRYIYTYQQNQPKKYAIIGTEQHSNISKSPLNYIVPQFCLRYNITQHIDIHAGVKMRFWGKQDFYHLKIQGNTFLDGYNDPTKAYLLNDTYFKNRFFMLSIGFGYNIKWKI